MDRLLSIILILMNKGTVTGRELAEHFEVSLRTIYRDIDKISTTIVPIASTGGKGGGFYILEDYKLDKMFFSKSEVKPLLSVLKSLKNTLGKNESFNSCIAKFESLYNSNNTDNNLSIDISDNGDGITASEYLDLINNAIEANRCVVFTYINRRLETEQRTAEPINIFFSGGYWYFTAFCRSRGDFRRFKLARIKDISLGEFFTKRVVTDEELDTIFRESFKNRSIEVVLKFSQRMSRRLVEYFREERISNNDDGTSIVTFNSPNEEGLKKYILSFGIDCEVLSPDFLREELKAYIEKLHTIYG
jgi:predicted DNA-binding transcriptional regulator YafY